MSSQERTIPPPFSIKLMLEGDDADGYVNSFQALSHGQEYNMEKFVCHLYGIRETEHVDAARTAKLFALAGVKKKSGLKTPEMKSKLKKVNCSLLPPCSKVLNMKIKRALYVSSIWTKAPGKEPSQGLSPADYGWEKVEGTWSPIWYRGSPLPEKLNDGDSREV